MANSHIAQRIGVSVGTVRAWRDRFAEDGLAKLGQVRRGRGRKPSISEEQIAEIVELTLHSKPEGHTHWSCRTMADRVGVSPATVQRIWDARGLKPHRVETFKLSNDPQFEDKLIDVVSLYLNPPKKAVVVRLQGKAERAARLWGTAEALREEIESLGDPTSRPSVIRKRHANRSLQTSCHCLDQTTPYLGARVGASEHPVGNDNDLLRAVGNPSLCRGG